MVLDQVILDHANTTAFDVVHTGNVQTMAPDTYHQAAEPLAAAGFFFHSRVHRSSSTFTEVASFFPTAREPTSFVSESAPLASFFTSHRSAPLASFLPSRRQATSFTDEDPQPPPQEKKGPPMASLASMATGNPRNLKGSCKIESTPDEKIRCAIGLIPEKAGNINWDGIQSTIQRATDALAYTKIKMKSWTHGAGDETAKAIAEAEGKNEEPAPSGAGLGAGAGGGNEQQGGSGTFLDEEVGGKPGGGQPAKLPKEGGGEKTPKQASA